MLPLPRSAFESGSVRGWGSGPVPGGGGQEPWSGVLRQHPADPQPSHSQHLALLLQLLHQSDWRKLGQAETQTNQKQGNSDQTDAGHSSCLCVRVFPFTCMYCCRPLVRPECGFARCVCARSKSCSHTPFWPAASKLRLSSLQASTSWGLYPR